MGARKPASLYRKREELARCSAGNSIFENLTTKDTENTEETYEIIQHSASIIHYFSRPLIPEGDPFSAPSVSSVVKFSKIEFRGSGGLCHNSPCQNRKGSLKPRWETTRQGVVAVICGGRPWQWIRGGHGEGEVFSCRFSVFSIDSFPANEGKRRTEADEDADTNVNPCAARRGCRRPTRQTIIDCTARRWFRRNRPTFLRDGGRGILRLW